MDAPVMDAPATDAPPADAPLATDAHRRPTAPATDAPATDSSTADGATDGQSADAQTPFTPLCANAACRFQSHLSLDTVFQVDIDSAGGVWFATRHGAVYLDPRATPTDVRDDRWNAWTTAHGLPGNDVRAVTVAPDGSKWFASVVDSPTPPTPPATSKVSRLFDNGTPLDGSDDVWLHYGTADGLPNNLTNHIMPDPRGGYWLANGGGGLYFLDDGGTPRNKADDSITRLIHMAPNGLPYYSLARVVRIGPDGALYVVSGDATVVRIDVNGTPRNALDDVVTRWTFEDGTYDFSGFDVAFDARGNLWLATTGGLEHIDLNATPTNKADDRYARFLIAEPPMVANYMGRRVWIDAAGDKWVGGQGGLMHLRDQGTPFDPSDDQKTWIGGNNNPNGSVHVTMVWFAVAADGALWTVSNGFGAVRYDHRGTPASEADDTFTVVDSLAEDNFTAVARSAAGHLWVATANRGASVYDDRGTPRGSDRRSLRRPSTPRDGMTGESVRDLAIDAAGPWLATHLGRLVQHRRRHALRQDRRHLGELDSARRPAELRDHGDRGRARQRQVDRHGQRPVVHGRQRDARRRRPTTASPTGRTSDGLAHNYVREIAFEGARIVWIATDGGLTRLDHGGTPTSKSDDVLTTFRMSDGLPASIAYGVTVDGNGRKWVAAHTGSAGAGIGVLSDNGTATKTDDVWVVINTADGLPHDAVEDIVDRVADRDVDCDGARPRSLRPQGDARSRRRRSGVGHQRRERPAQRLGPGDRDRGAQAARGRHPRRNLRRPQPGVLALAVEVRARGCVSQRRVSRNSRARSVRTSWWRREPGPACSPHSGPGSSSSAPRSYRNRGSEPNPSGRPREMRAEPSRRAAR